MRKRLFLSSRFFEGTIPSGKPLGKPRSLSGLLILISFDDLIHRVRTSHPNFEIGGKSSFVDPSQYPDDPNMPALEDIVYSDDEDDVGAEADFSNLEIISPIPTTRVHKDHPVIQIISDLYSATQTRSMTRVAKDQELEGITYSDDEEDVSAEADFTNLEISITVSPIPTTR
nr:hypothetical protein [Tanacetum cinerariifolium]